MSSEVEQEAKVVEPRAISVRCPRCGARMIQEVIDDELCWVCPTPCGCPSFPV